MIFSTGFIRFTFVGRFYFFFLAICGNLAHYIETSGQSYLENDFGLGICDDAVTYFNKSISVTGASTLIVSYVTFVPFLIYSILWYRKSAIQYSYMELLCAYGYSLAIFIPVSVSRAHLITELKTEK